MIIVDQVTPSAPKNIPNGMKNMFATLCSNPIHTNAMIGNQIPKNLPTTSSAALAKYTAKHTNQLQPIPLRKACTQVKEAVEKRKVSTFKATSEIAKLVKHEIDNMKAVGLIVEYNPLHNGHLYHLKKAQKARFYLRF